MLWPGLSSTYYDQIALWFYEENVTHLAMPGIAKADLTWNSVKGKARTLHGLKADMADESKYFGGSYQNTSPEDQIVA